MQYVNRRTLSAEEKAEQARLRAEREAAQRLKNNQLGITVFQATWILIFVCLVVVNLLMRTSPDWLKEGYTRPDVAIPTLASVLLLGSSAACYVALKAVKRSDTPRFERAWLLAMLTGLAFFILMLQQFFSYPIEAGQSAFIFRLMVGYHALHALGVGVFMLQIYRFAQVPKGRYHAQNFWNVEATTRLWYFVAVAWIMFYIVLYWL